MGSTYILFRLCVLYYPLHVLLDVQDILVTEMSAASFIMKRPKAYMSSWPRHIEQNWLHCTCICWRNVWFRCFVQSATLYRHVNYSVVCVCDTCVRGVQCWGGVLSVCVIEYTGWSRELITVGARQARTKSLHRQHNSHTTEYKHPKICPGWSPATTDPVKK